MKRERKPVTPQEGLDIVDFNVKGRGGHEIGIRSYIPTGGSDLPLLIYMHGGGFFLGGLENGELKNRVEKARLTRSCEDDRACRRIALNLHASVANVEYGLAPEHPFHAVWKIVKIACDGYAF
jgi:acetyl esterase